MYSQISMVSSKDPTTFLHLVDHGETALLCQIRGMPMSPRTAPRTTRVKGELTLVTTSVTQVGFGLSSHLKYIQHDVCTCMSIVMNLLIFEGVVFDENMQICNWPGNVAPPCGTAGTGR